jgi:putative mRNA 3-end processing factor
MLDSFGFIPSDLRSKAMITRRGAVLLGKNFAVDAHEDRAVRVVTHAHADHILDLEESLRGCDRVVMTPATSELIESIYSTELDSSKLELLDYGKSMRFGDERLTLFQAGHILGSAQVLVETGEGYRILYTGDFKLPEAPIINSDLLVIEATYGNPSCTRPFKDRVEDELVSLVKDSLRDGPVHIFGYHGKLQEVAGVLRRGGVMEPILMSRKVYAVAKICEKYGMELGDFLLDECDEGRRASKGNYVGLYHMRVARGFEGGGTKIYLSGWEFEAPVKRIGRDEYEVALSDHSDFEQLIEYIESSDPRYVITDDFRVGDAKALAREIKKRLGKQARPMP